jgi:isopenicillin-N N-acyltransferase-like protein
MGAGHHYLVADRSIAYGIETSGTETRTVFSGPQPRYVHTNHCLNDAIAAQSIVAQGSTSHERFDLMTSAITSQIQSMDHVWKLLGSHEQHPRSICTHLASEESPHAMATCAGISMDLNRRELWMEEGCLHEREPQRFGFRK